MVEARNSRKGTLTLDQLRESVNRGEIDTVIVGFTDHSGRLMGKRYAAEMFVDDTAAHGTHGCDYLLTTNMEMDPLSRAVGSDFGLTPADCHPFPELVNG